MGCSDGAPRIAGNLTTEDWDERKMLLDGDDATDADWRKAVDDFFLQRIQKRYLDPIKILQVIGDGDGEGFAIVTIQCALIEFLAALRSGKKYTTKRGQVGENEYNSCRELFRDFLHPVSPFATCFPSPESAENFYKFIRCGLLHEAQSKSGWRIRNIGSLPVDHDAKTLNRDSFQRIIERYIDVYVDEIKESKPLKDAFLSKFTHICETALEAPRQP